MIMQTINRFFQYTDIDTDTNTRGNWMFMGGVLGYCLLTYLVFGHSLFSGEPWAETATLYFQNATGRLDQFLVKDFGYLVWPQQIIVWVGQFFEIPSRYIPYFYNGVGTLIMGLMIFVFCLPRFKCLIPNDIFRLILCITVACIATVETREFINFTYYSAFFITIICAMMMVAKPDKLPWYVKTLPIFFLAKPAILGVFPILILALFYTKNNFRWILGLCFIAVTIQLLNIYYFPYILPQETGPAFIDQLMTFINHSKIHINALWQVQFTPILPAFAKYMLTIGTIASLFYVCYTWKHPAKILIIFGLFLIIGTDFVVSFGVKGIRFEIWKGGVETGRIFRWTIIQIIGMVIIAGALCLYFSEKIDKYQFRYGRYVSAIPLFIVWLVVSDWADKFYDTNKSTGLETQSIAWQSNHDDGVFDRVCTSIRPLGWIYNPGVSCARLGNRYINPNQTPVLPNTPVSLLKPADLGNRAVQSIIAVYHVPVNYPDYQLILKVNDIVLTKIIPRTSRVSKNMAVQFNLPTLINGESISTISLQSSALMYVSTDNDQLPENAHAHWYVK